MRHFGTCLWHADAPTSSSNLTAAIVLSVFETAKGLGANAVGFTLGAELAQQVVAFRGPEVLVPAHAKFLVCWRPPLGTFPQGLGAVHALECRSSQPHW